MVSFTQIGNVAKGKARENGNQNVIGKAGKMRLFRKKESDYNIYEEALMAFTKEIDSGKLDNYFYITEEHSGNYIISIKYAFRKAHHIFNNLDFIKVLNYGVTTRVYHSILNGKKINYHLQNSFASAMDRLSIRKSKRLEDKVIDSLSEYVRENKAEN